jgi:hypothetical protein
MASYLSQIIHNTLGFSDAGQIQPEIQHWQYPGLSNEPNPFVDHENSLPRSDFDVNDSSEKGKHIERPYAAISIESPVQDIPASPFENAEGSVTRSRKASGKKKDKPHDQEKAVQQKQEAKTIISTEITSGILVPPVKKMVVPIEPVSRKESQSKSFDEPHQSFPINLKKEESTRSSKKAKQVIKNNEEIIKHNETFPDKKIKMVEPDISSHPIFHQHLIQPLIEMGIRDVLPNEPVVPIPVISKKRETRLVIGKLTVEVIQPIKEKNIPVPQPIMVNNKPAKTSQRRNEGGSTLKVKYGLGQI